MAAFKGGREAPRVRERPPAGWPSQGTWLARQDILHGLLASQVGCARLCMHGH
jgi:hypothetical protein